jgi:dephospho-CoA kinase
MKKKRCLVAITGSQGAGKSEVLNFLRELGYEVYSADEISKEIFNENFQEIYNLFKDYFTENTNFDIQGLRRKIALIISRDKSMKKKLEDFIWPRVKERLGKMSENSKTVFVEIPLLFEANMEGDFDNIWIVDAPFEVRLNRLIKSRGYTEEEARIRMNLQWPPSKPIDQCKVPIQYIDGGNDIEDVKKRVLELLDSF